MSSLMWFRSDLRVYDNPALTAAMQAGATVAVYFLCNEQWDRHDVSPAKKKLMLNQLASLETSLSELNVPLRIIDCQVFEKIPECLSVFLSEIPFNALFCNLEYEYNERKLTASVRQWSAEKRLTFKTFHDQCALPPGDVGKEDGSAYQVFTPFKRRYLALFDQRARPIFNRPLKQSALPINSDLSALAKAQENLSASIDWPAGEDAAHDALNSFVESKLKNYAQDRDLPAVPGTSVISPYLAIGALSTTQCYHAVLSYGNGTLHEGGSGRQTWISELVWRDFYRHLLVAFPRLSQHKPFKQETDALPWSQEIEHFTRWCEGKTGYPIVDAGMRQLNQTGWMHNRVRMICAMFLSKHLMIDWRMGERYFMKTLVDGDLASNNGGWQWSASTGVDAAPYFRIFNPERQSRKFDEAGKYIRRFVEELAPLNEKDIHQPSQTQCLELGYPEPIVDHRTVVERTKSAFAQLSSKAKIEEPGAMA